MMKSILYLTSNNLNEINKELIKDFETVVIDLNIIDSLSEYQLIEEVIEKLNKEGISIYLGLDTLNLKKTYGVLKNLAGSNINGWYIPHVSIKLLNKLVTRARDFEQAKKLSFGKMDFILSITNLTGIEQIKSLVNYERVSNVLFDEKAFKNYLGLSSEVNLDNYQKLVALETINAQKQFLDGSYNFDYKYFKSLSAVGKITSNTDDIVEINKQFTPSKEEALNAKKIIDLYINTEISKRKFLTINNLEISKIVIVKQLNIINSYYNATKDNNFLENRLVIKRGKIYENKSKEPIVKFYTLGEEIGNSISHGIGVLFSIAFLVLLIIKGLNSNSSSKMFAYIIYSMSALLLYSMSMVYHSVPLGRSAKRFFQRLDHMTIYLLIAGTYTPFSLITIGGKQGVILCSFIWSAAFIGLLLNLFMFGKFKKLHLLLYIAIGWVAIFFMKTIIASLGSTGTILLISGGVAYTLGVLFYALKLFKFNHMVWHFFVLIGTILHFLTIYLYV